MEIVLSEAKQNPLSTGKQRGRLILIVGPSGSGKDTLIEWLKSRCNQDERILFVQRIITRRPDATGENHISMSQHRFEGMKEQGRFAVTWDAHELRYALPIEALHHVENGGIAIANGSRRSLDEIEAIFRDVVVVKLTVDEDVLRNRLVARARENKLEIEQRIKAASLPVDTKSTVIEIDNSGSIDKTGCKALEAITRLLINPEICSWAHYSKKTESVTGT